MTSSGTSSTRRTSTKECLGKFKTKERFWQPNYRFRGTTLPYEELFIALEKTIGENTMPFKSVEGAHRCIKFRSANVVKPLISMRKVVQAGSVVALDEKNPHIRNN